MYNTTNLQVFNYGNNNPVKYNDPTGESPALAVAIPAAGKTVGAVAVSIGPIGWVVIGAVAVVGVGIVVYNHTKASTKAKEQAKAVAKEDENHKANRLVIQIQDCTKGNSKDTLATSGTQYGNPSVSNVQALNAVDMVVNDLQKTNNSMAKSQDFQRAIKELQGKILASAPQFDPIKKNAYQALFDYQGNKYRIDIDSYVLKGNPPNLLE